MNSVDDGGRHGDDETKYNEWTERRRHLLRPILHDDKEPISYTVASSILSMKECDDAKDTIWLFLNYTTVGHIQRDDPNTWSTIPYYSAMNMPTLPNIFMTMIVVVVS